MNHVFFWRDQFGCRGNFIVKNLLLNVQDFPRCIRMVRAVLRVAVLAAAAACVLDEKGDLYGKDGPEKNSIVEQVCAADLPLAVKCVR